MVVPVTVTKILYQAVSHSLPHGGSNSGLIHTCLEEALAEKSGNVNEGLAEGTGLSSWPTQQDSFLYCSHLAHTFVYVLKEKP